MEHVTIVGTEDNVLVLATESGTRFALPIDEVLRREMRRAQSKSAPASSAISPREIQAHIRSGLTSAEVAELLGIDAEDVARFEGPVLAEREHIIGQALSVPVLLGSEVEPAAQPTFGAAIRAKLAGLDATEERWASWKEDRGWIVKLEFTASDVTHDARWSFEPRSGTLAPLNADATQLSRQGTLSDGLIPRLRALESERPSPYKDDSRFDTDVFEPEALIDTDVADEHVRPERASAAVQEAAMTRAPEEITTSAETADLLEALRRRRGQRDAPPALETEDEHDNDPIALFEALEEPPTPEEPSDRPVVDPAPAGLADSSHRKRRRESMPSWDEIVFGARTED